MNDDLELLTPTEAAKLLKMHKEFVYDECKAGRLKHARMGRVIRIRPADLAAYVETRFS